MKRSIIALQVFTVLLSCSNSAGTSTNNSESKSLVNKTEQTIVTEPAPAREGSLTYKANGVLFVCKPETVKGFYTQKPQTGSFGGVVDGKNFYKMAYNAGEPTGEIPVKNGNYVNYPELMYNGKLYESIHCTIKVTTIVTDAVAVTKGVYVISGTFEGTFEDGDGNKVVITEGKFITPLPLKM